MLYSNQYNTHIYHDTMLYSKCYTMCCIPHLFCCTEPRLLYNIWKCFTAPPKMPHVTPLCLPSLSSHSTLVQHWRYTCATFTQHSDWSCSIVKFEGVFEDTGYYWHMCFQHSNNESHLQWAWGGIAESERGWRVEGAPPALHYQRVS